jgi:hypothetical protein
LRIKLYRKDIKVCDLGIKVCRKAINVLCLRIKLCRKDIKVCDLGIKVRRKDIKVRRKDIFFT